MATTKVSTKLLETVGVAEGGTGATSTSAARTSLGLGTVATLDTVSVATGGTGATSASAARTALGLVIGTNVLAPGGDGSSLTGIAGGATDAEKANIMLNSFRIASVGGLSVLNMVDGVVDEFEDETGIDTGASINETYNAAGDYYDADSPLIDSHPESNDTGNWAEMHSSQNIGGQALTLSSAATLVSCKFYISKVGSPTGTVVAKIYAVTGTIGTNGDITGPALATSNTVDVATIPGSATLIEFTFPAPYSASAGGICVVMDYSGGNSSNFVKIHIDGLNPTHPGNMILPDGTWGNDALFYLYGSTNMTLFSNATTALATPTDAFIVLWQEDVDAITLNTDLRAYASRDGGSTYTQITLNEDTALTADGGYTSDLIPTMTSTTAPSGTVTGTPTDRQLHGPFADDGDTTSWRAWNGSASLPAFLAYEWGSAKTVAQYTLTSHTGESIYAPKDWTFDGWNGSSWITLHTVTNQTSWGSPEKRTFVPTTTGSYVKYRIYITAVNGASYPVLAEMEMMESITLSQRILSGSVDISGQPSGTSMKYKIETLNTKEQKIHAVALQWS